MLNIGFRGSLGLSYDIFKMASLILIPTRHATLCLSLTFSYLAMFCKTERYPKHRKTLSWGKFIIINFTLSDIDNTKPSVSRVQFMITCNLFPTFGCVVRCFFLRATSLLIPPKIGCPVNFLVVSDDRTTRQPLISSAAILKHGLTSRANPILFNISITPPAFARIKKIIIKSGAHT